MSKFNQVAANRNLTVNSDGAVAYKMGDKEKLITQVLTSLFNETKFYGDNSEDILQTVKSVIGHDAKFVANLCIYARNEMHLRTISHVLVRELARHEKGKQYVRKVLNKIVERADDMTEILAYYLKTNEGKPLSNPIKKGLSDTFKRFDEYQLAKYNRDNAVKLKDILCLARPRPENKEQEELWKRVLEGRLTVPVTWETELSTKGNSKEVWETLIAENKLGYMAMMRNLRNIINSKANNIDKVYDFLTNEERVLKNKQLPFRYYAAYRILKDENIGTSKVYDALEKAIKISTNNVNRLGGKTFISADVSGSMTSNKISAKSDTTCGEIAALMMAIANYICEETITTTFDSRLYSCNLPTTNGIISNANSVKMNGGSTDITLPLVYLLQKEIFVDRIIILSDNVINSDFSRRGYRGNTCCQDLVEKYRQFVNPNVWVHAIDIMGYGTQQFMGKNVNVIAGWSEKILDFIHTTEQGIETLEQKISGYYFK
jgi:60 kDa SS-A/Ro ribonucleoprotein